MSERSQKPVKYSPLCSTTAFVNEAQSINLIMQTVINNIVAMLLLFSLGYAKVCVSLVWFSIQLNFSLFLTL